MRFDLMQCYMYRLPCLLWDYEVMFGTLLLGKQELQLYLAALTRCGAESAAQGRRAMAASMRSCRAHTSAPGGVPRRVPVRVGVALGKHRLWTTLRATKTEE